MPRYSQKLVFEREVSFEARDAAAANERLERIISESEFHGDVRCTDSYEFEDEPVTCPNCKGLGVVGDDEITCGQCKGECCIPFVAS